MVPMVPTAPGRVVLRHDAVSAKTIICLEQLLRRLRSARMAVIADDMKAAQVHIEEVLELLNDAIAERTGPKPSVRAIRGYIAEAGYAITKSDSRRAVSGLDEALRELE